MSPDWFPAHAGSALSRSAARSQGAPGGPVRG
jgi:hypothetical protein